MLLAPLAGEGDERRRRSPSLRERVQLVGAEDLVELLARKGLALERGGGEVVEAFAIGGQQRPRAAVGLARQGHRRQVDVAAGRGGDGGVAPRQGERPRAPPGG